MVDIQVQVVLVVVCTGLQVGILGVCMCLRMYGCSGNSLFLFVSVRSRSRDVLGVVGVASGSKYGLLRKLSWYCHSYVLCSVVCAKRVLCT